MEKEEKGKPVILPLNTEKKAVKRVHPQKYAPYTLVSDYITNGATSDQIKAVENLESQIGFSLAGAFVEREGAKPFSPKTGEEVTSASRVVLHWHKQFFAYVEQGTLATVGGIVCKRIK